MSRYLASLVILSVVAFGGMAQQMPKIVVVIPFQFKADMELLPAGTYELQPNNQGTHIQLRDVKTDKRFIARVLTSLSTRGTSQSIVAFDVEGQNHYLSEIYIAGTDGFAVEAVKGKHTHITIPAQE